MSAAEPDADPIYIFDLDGRYIFKQYFERPGVFEQLQSYYKPEEYHFEVPAEEFNNVQTVLENNDYRTILVEDLVAFGVVKEAYTEHADILRNAVLHWSRDDYNFFLMKDPDAVAYAVEQGAERIEDTHLVLGI